MNEPANIFRLPGGMIQGQQTPDALASDHFLIDERDTMKLLSDTASLASVLNYYNFNGAYDGNWESLLLADVSILTARIAQYDGLEKFNQFLTFQNAANQNEADKEHDDFILNSFRLAFDAILQVDAWYKQSNQNFTASRITNYLRNQIINSGSNLLASLYEQYHARYKADPSQEWLWEALKNIDATWSFNPFPIDSTQASLSKITTCGQQIFNWLDEIVEHAKDEYQLSVQRQDMPPHIGLLLSFLDLFKLEQEAINTITGRHLDFYYKQILLSKPKPARPDHAIVTVELAKGVEQFTIPKGAIVDAGKDEKGVQITFSTQQDVTVTKARIADYVALAIPSEEETNAVEDFAMSVVSDFNVLGNRSWPLFHAYVPQEGVKTNSSTAGFAISCPDLLLLQSTRNVTLILIVSEESKNIIPNLPKGSIFTISVTSIKGWISVAADDVQYKDNTIVIGFSLSITDPPVVPYAEKIHGAGYSTTWPVCKIVLSEKGKAGYGVFKDIIIRSAVITTEVSGMSDFLVENDSGKLSPAVPFAPFNVTTRGGTLYIGGQELFIKQLSEITLTITWDKLPQSFKEYYKAYNDFYSSYAGLSDIVKGPAFQNQSFCVTSSVLIGNDWVTAFEVNGSQSLSTFNLFTSDTSGYFPEQPIVANGQKKITLKRALIEGKLKPFPFNPDLPPFKSLNDPVNEGFICLTLSAPTRGFGYSDYPEIVSAIALENSQIIMNNARWFTKKQKVKPVPNIPYVPKIKMLEVDYKSSQNYDFTSSAIMKWYHIYPTGQKEIEPSKSGVPLLPVYPMPFYNYFSLDGLVSDTELSFCFVIENTSGKFSYPDNSDFSYEYLSSDGWKPLVVLSDSTDGFQTTGIVRFMSPEDASNSNPEMPLNLYWVRMGAQRASSVRVKYVSTQALTLFRNLSNDNSLSPIPTGTITKFIDSIPSIKKVVQPAPSSGAVAHQSEHVFRRAVATRINYKRRIISAADAEPVILDEFPELFKVTSIPAGYSNSEMNGTVNILLVPFKAKTDDNPYMPVATPDQMERVLDFISGLGMPSVRFEVSCPRMFKLKVTCTVLFFESDQDVALCKRLSEEINNFISPWIEGATTDAILFTPASSEAQVYSFIKSRDYVKSINQFSLSIGDPNSTIQNIGPHDLIIPATDHAITAMPLRTILNQEAGLVKNRISRKSYVNS